MDSSEIVLEENQVVSFKEAQTIKVTSGNLWMTMEGNAEDFFYSEGDKFFIPDGKHTVIQALGKSSFWF